MMEYLLKNIIGIFFFYRCYLLEENKYRLHISLITFLKCIVSIVNEYFSCINETLAGFENILNKQKYWKTIWIKTEIFIIQFYYSQFNGFVCTIFRLHHNYYSQCETLMQHLGNIYHYWFITKIVWIKLKYLLTIKI